MEKRRDIATGALLMALAAFYLLASRSIKAFAVLGASRLTAASVPRFWGVLLVILGALMVLRGVRKPAGTEEGARRGLAAGIKAWCWENYAVLGTFLFLGLYILALDKVGFLPATVVYLFAQIMLLGKRERKYVFLAAAVSAAASLCIYLLFRYPLGMPLPKGLMPF